MNKRTFTLASGLLVLGMAWALWISHLNSRVTVVDIQVSGALDEVRIYQEQEPDQPLHVLQTQGVDLLVQLELRNAKGNSFLSQQAPAQYYFVMVKGDAVQRGRIFCCSTGFTNQHRSLTIHDLGEYESSSLK